MRLRASVAGFLSVIAVVGVLAFGATTAAAEDPVPELFAADLSGSVPVNGFGLLQLESDATPQQVTTALAAAGCDAASIAVSEGGSLLRHRPAGVTDDGFPDQLAAGRAVLVECTPAVGDLDLANGSYELDGLTIDLEDGHSEFPAAPGSASQVTTDLTNWQAVGDLDGDAVVDIAGVVVHSTGGTGNFRYLITQLSEHASITGQFLGDRILIQRISIEGAVVEVNYLDHAPGQGLASPPTVATSRGFTLSEGALIETPAGTWHLISIDGAALVDGTAIDASFTSGTVSGSAGCNQYSGGYQIDARSLTIGPPIAVTAKACESAILAQEQAYLAALETAQTFALTGDTLALETAGADLLFQRASVQPHGAWTLTDLDGAAIVEGAAITANFDGSTVSGSAGCNSYSGGYEIAARALSVGPPIAVTAKACETSIMDQEQAYLAALTGAQRFSLVGDTLTVETTAGTLTFARTS